MSNIETAVADRAREARWQQIRQALAEWEDAQHHAGEWADVTLLAATRVAKATAVLVNHDGAAS